MGHWTVPQQVGGALPFSEGPCSGVDITDGFIAADGVMIALEYRSEMDLEKCVCGKENPRARGFKAAQLLLTWETGSQDNKQLMEMGSATAEQGAGLQGVALPGACGTLERASLAAQQILPGCDS